MVVRLAEEECKCHVYDVGVAFYFLEEVELSTDASDFVCPSSPLYLV